MAYYWITEAQSYIQSLGFGSTRRPVNMTSQAVRINQWGQDNSFATDHPKNELRFGKGGVDDAEDAEVILHEYGHAIHFAQNFVFAQRRGRRDQRGVRRLLGGDRREHRRNAARRARARAAAVRRRLGLGLVHLDVPHCLRRVDSNLMYPADLERRGPYDGMIWSRALWDIRQASVTSMADTIILEGQFDFPGTGMPELARRTVASAQQIYGSATAAAVSTAFQARGIL